jgi:surface antigen
MKRSAIALVLAGTLALGACAGAGQKETAGGIGGAVIGGLLGSQIGQGTGKVVATGIGAALGSLAGSSIGRGLDQRDQLLLRQATQRSLETQPDGAALPWRNSDTGNSGYIVPQRTYQADNTYCREYQTTVVVGGRSEKGFGTACRQPDGSWRIVS